MLWLWDWSIFLQNNSHATDHTVCAEALHNMLKWKYWYDAPCTSYPTFIQLLKYIPYSFTQINCIKCPIFWESYKLSLIVITHNNSYPNQLGPCQLTSKLATCSPTFPTHSHVSAYPHCAAVSAVACHFLTIPALSAGSGRLFWWMVGCRPTPFTSAASINGQSSISEWKYVTE